jgi:hypothetical protein
MALQHPLVVYNAADHVEAHLLCNALVDAGIDAYVIDDVSQVGTSALGLLPEIHKPQIWVERADVERARAILDEHQHRILQRVAASSSGAGDSPSRIRVVCEDCGKAATYPASQSGSVQQCPHCGGFVDVWVGADFASSSNPYCSQREAGAISEARCTSNLVSPALYRTAAMAALTCWLASMAPSFGLIQFSGPMEDVRSWNYFDAVAPDWAADLWWWTLTAATPIGLLGLMCFWSPARWLLIASLLVGTIGSLFMGLVVMSPFEQALGSGAFLLTIWLLSVSFGSSAAPYFAGPHGLPDPDGQGS